MKTWSKIILIMTVAISGFAIQSADDPEALRQAITECKYRSRKVGTPPVVKKAYIKKAKELQQRLDNISTIDPAYLKMDIQARDTVVTLDPNHQAKIDALDAKSAENQKEIIELKKKLFMNRMERDQDVITGEPIIYDY